MFYTHTAGAYAWFAWLIRHIYTHIFLNVRFHSHAHEYTVCAFTYIPALSFLSLLDTAVRRREGVWVVSWQ